MRKIGELLKLPYFELDEEELEAVIEYKAQQKANEEEAKQRETTLNNALAEMQALARESAEQANRNFKYACSINPAFEVVTYGKE